MSCVAGSPMHAVAATAQVRLEAPHAGAAAELLQFELENRAYFERWINARSASYYSLDGVCQAIGAADEDRASDGGYQFLVRVDDALVGRVNLAKIQRAYFNRAELGYRIGERHLGRGYASAAVAAAVRIAFEDLDLWRIEASVRAGNEGSARVLQRNGFREFGCAAQAMRLNGMWHDLIQFELRNPSPQPQAEARADVVAASQHARPGPGTMSTCPTVMPTP